jgi:3-hydroxy-9,10-secoandrosta-1,3,5(10)-triene-9,17-dione monooxygenase
VSKVIEPAAKVSREEFLARAEELLPTLRERAAETERQRRVPQETIDAFVKAGLFRGLQPARWGGLEVDPATFYEAVAMVASACVSSGWVLGVVGVHDWHVALFPLQTQEEIWGKDGSVLIASSYAPIGRVKHVDGGFRLSGRWSFSSGIDPSEWVLTNSIVPEVDNPERRHGYTFIFPKSELQVIDDWYVAGLQGSGSKTFAADDIFIPEHRAIRLSDTRGLRTQGLEVNPSSLFRIPQMNIFLWAVSAPAVGAARGMLELFREQGAKRIGTNPKAPLLSDTFAHENLGRATFKVDAASWRLRRDNEEMLEMAQNGSSFPFQDRSRFRGGAAYAVDESVSAIDLLFEAAGGFAIQLDNPMQRFFRDAHAIRIHAANNVRRAAASYGRVQLPLAEDDGTL